MGASIGVIDTARHRRRQMMFILKLFSVNQPEVMIGDGGEKFAEPGNLTDETTKGFIRRLLQRIWSSGRGASASRSR
jgi:hypothetical protein